MTISAKAWHDRARKAGEIARTRSARVPAERRFEAWWERYRATRPEQDKATLYEAFMRGWLRASRDLGVPLPSKPEPKRPTRAQAYEALSVSAEKYIDRHFSESVEADAAWRVWADIIGITMHKAKVIRPEFVEAWTDRLDRIQDARECAAREADRVARAAAAGEAM